MRTLAISHQRDAGPGVFAEAVAAAGHELDLWHVAETDVPPADPGAYDAVMTFGGAMHPDQGADHPWLEPEVSLLAELVHREVPVLGVCLGSQLLACATGGEVRRAREPEIGWNRVEVNPAGSADPVLAPLAPGFEAFGWHSYEAVPAAEAEVLATSAVCPQAYRVGPSAWGIQFHAEVSAADALGWIEDYESDPDAVRVGIDPVALTAETRPRIEAWNELGRGLCARFLAAAAAA